MLLADCTIHFTPFAFMLSLVVHSLVTKAWLECLTRPGSFPGISGRYGYASVRVWVCTEGLEVSAVKMSHLVVDPHVSSWSTPLFIFLYFHSLENVTFWTCHLQVLYNFSYYWKIFLLILHIINPCNCFLSISYMISIFDGPLYHLAPW